MLEHHGNLAAEGTRRRSRDRRVRACCNGGTPLARNPICVQDAAGRTRLYRTFYASYGLGEFI
jgi:hypothetical protein